MRHAYGEGKAPPIQIGDLTQAKTATEAVTLLNEGVQRYTMKAYSLGYKLTMEMMHDRDYKAIQALRHTSRVEMPRLRQVVSSRPSQSSGQLPILQEDNSES